MPVPYFHSALTTDVVESYKLVVDKGFQRSNINAADGGRRLFLHQCDDGEEGCLRLSRGCGGRQQHVGTGVENGIPCCSLYGAELLPPFLIDVPLDSGGVPGEDVHECIDWNLMFSNGYKSL